MDDQMQIQSVALADIHYAHDDKQQILFLIIIST